MKTGRSLPVLMTGFFQSWLVGQCNVSHHTVCAYRDAWCQLLRFVAERRAKPVAAVDLPDLTADEVLAFLQSLETERKVSVGTRNCRLAAIRSFFSYVAGREPAAAAQCAQVLQIPTKRAPRAALAYLDPDEVEAILKQPDRGSPMGERDHALLALLYTTGARIQEALAVRPCDIRFEPPPQVRLYGKGRKERFCPVLPEMAELLLQALRRESVPPEQPVFRNRYGHALGASGVRFRLRGYVAAAVREAPTLARKHVTPHTFRRTCAVHLLASGVDVTVIQGWLGHASLDTTNHYAQANLETKRRALELLPPVATLKQPPPWRRDRSLLAWLESL
jgi:site-specific recombinase XerD